MEKCFFFSFFHSPMFQHTEKAARMSSLFVPFDSDKVSCYTLE